MKTKSLYKHQKDLIDKNPERWLLAHDTGTGKTRTAIELAIKRDVDTLVIMPKALKENWKREWSKWGGKDGVLFYTKEEFRRDWKKIPKAELVISDEHHHFLGSKSQMMKSMRGYFKKHDVPYRLFLTATPYRSTPMDVYIMADLWGKPLSYPWFMSEFFVEKWFGNRRVMTPKPKKEKDLAQIVSMYGNTVKMADCIDIPEQKDVVVEFEMTKAQLKAVKDLEYDLPIVYFTKRHQIEQGYIPGDKDLGTKPQPITSDKVQYILERAQNAQKLAIFCRYHAQIDILEEALKKKKIEVGVISGKVKDRDSVVQAAEKEDRSIILIQADCAEGYNLSTFGHVIYASQSWNYVSYYQSKGRFLRANNPTPTLIEYLVTKPYTNEKKTKYSIDLAVQRSMKQSTDFSATIYDFEISDYNEENDRSETELPF